MTVKQKRSARWFYVLLVVLIAVAYCGIVAASTVDSCGKDAPKRWNWFPPKWECVHPT